MPARRATLGVADSRSAGNSLMSAPATNARSPPPRRTIARTAVVGVERSISASSSSRSAAESAFMGGLSMVTTATAPSLLGGDVGRPCACVLAVARPRQRTRTARAAPSCGTCRPRSSGSRPRTRTDRAATTSRSSARGGRAARRRRARPLAQDDDRERPLRPLLVGHRDHGRLGDGLVAHQRVLERDGRDPLAARLDEVLGAVLHLDVAVGMDRDDVAGLEPAVVRPAVGRVGRVVVRRR